MDEWVRVKKDDIVAIAEAIKEGLGITSTFKISDMPALIREISDHNGSTLDDIKESCDNMTEANELLTEKINTNNDLINDMRSYLFTYNNDQNITVNVINNSTHVLVNPNLTTTLYIATNFKIGSICAVDITGFRNAGIREAILNNRNTIPVKYINNGELKATVQPNNTLNLTTVFDEYQIIRLTFDNDGSFIYMYLNGVER